MLHEVFSSCFVSLLWPILALTLDFTGRLRNTMTMSLWFSRVYVNVRMSQTGNTPDHFKTDHEPDLPYLTIWVRGVGGTVGELQAVCRNNG